MKLDRAVTVRTTQLAPDNFEYMFIPGSDGLLTRIAIVAPIRKPERFRTTMDTTHPEPTSTVVFEMDDELVAQIRAEFHALESQLSFRFPLCRIMWEWPHFELIRETAAEREAFQVYGYGTKEERRRAPMPADEDAVIDVVKSRFVFAPLTVPLSFYREGLAEYDQFRFISAFVSFYFVLEGLYGQGNTKNRLVEKAFTDSSTFRNAVIASLAAAGREQPGMYARVTAAFAAGELALDETGAARFLVRTRGRLHHFTNSVRRLEGTPFTHKEFEVAAFLAKIITTFALSGEMVALGATLSA